MIFVASKLRIIRQKRIHNTHYFDELPLLRDELDSPLRFLGKKFCCSDYFVYFCIIIKPKRMTIRQRFYLLTASLLMYLSVYPQIDSKLTYRRYTTQDGLPQLQAERLWQDSRGYIYIGTLSGFVRYDGREFTPFLKGRRENIVGFTEYGGQVRALGFRRQWIVGWDEVEMKPVDASGQWLLNNFNSGDLPNGLVLLEDEQEQHRCICKVTEEGFEKVISLPAFDRMTPDRKLYFDRHRLYIPSGNIYTYHRLGDKLYAFGCDGISIVEGRKLVRRVCAAPPEWKETYFGLTVRGEQTAIIADEHSLYTFDGKQVKQIATGFNLIKDLLIDRWGRLWVATYEGVYCFFNRNFTIHRLADGNDIVRAVSPQMVMGTLNGKVINKGEIISDDPAQFYQSSAVTIGDTVYLAGNGDIAAVSNGKLSWLHLPRDRYQFLAMAGRRLIIGSRKVVTAYNPQTGLIDTLSTEIPHPWCAAQDQQGHLWVGSSFGLFVDGEKKDYPQKLVITTMEADRAGNIFFASADSLFMIRNAQVKSITLPTLQGHEVRSLHISPRGYIVVAVIDGLFVGHISNVGDISDLRFFNHLNGFTALEPLKATMAETDDGTVWVCGVEEMTSFKPEYLLAYSEEDTFITPPLRWWQHWWIWIIGLLLLSMTIWLVAYRYEKLRNRRQLIQLEQEKLERQQRIDTIRQKAMEADENHQESSMLAKEIVKIAQLPKNSKLSFRTINGMVSVEAEEIAYFKADGNYTTLVTFRSQDTIFSGIGSLEKTLDQSVFVRADRSTLVNLHRISRLNSKQRTCTFRATDGTEVETTLLSPAFKRIERLL